MAKGSGAGGGKKNVGGAAGRSVRERGLAENQGGSTIGEMEDAAPVQGGGAVTPTPIRRRRRRVP